MIGKGEFFGLLGPNGAGQVDHDRDADTSVVPRAAAPASPGSTRARTRPRSSGGSGSSRSRTRSIAADRAGRTSTTTPATSGRPRDARQRADDAARAVRARRPRPRDGVRAFRRAGAAADDRAALAHRPAVLFLDEPTSGHRPADADQPLGAARRPHREGQTILLTTHYLEEADALCERIAILDRGRVLALGAPARLKEHARRRHVISSRSRATPPAPAPAAAIPGVRSVEADGDCCASSPRAPAGVLAALSRASPPPGCTSATRRASRRASRPSSCRSTGREYRE